MSTEHPYTVRPDPYASSRPVLKHEKRVAQDHIASCCGAARGQCEWLPRLDEIRFLLAEETPDVQ